MKGLAGYGTVNELNRSNLDDVVAVQRVEPSCLGLEDGITHRKTVPPPVISSRR